MSGTFVCPHCGASYPIKPVLVGRAVRCTTCKNAFSLRPDGVADKVAPAAPPPAPAPPAPASPPPAIAPPPRAVAPELPQAMVPKSGSQVNASGNSAPATKPESQRMAKPGTPRLTKPGTTRLTKQQEDERRTLAASLASAAHVALQAEAGKPEPSEATKRGTSTIKRPHTKHEGSVGKIGPAVTTGEGLRNHRNNLLWLAGVVGLIGLGFGISILLSWRSPQRAALESYAAVVEGVRGQHPGRLSAIQERAWIIGVPALSDLGSAKIGATQVIALSGAKPAIDGIVGLTYQRARDLWAPSSADIGKLWQDKRDRAWNLKRLQDAKIAVVDQADLRARAKDGGVPDDGVELLIELLISQPTPCGADMHKRLLAGDLPASVETCTFTGRGGSLLQDLGRGFKRRTVDYQGRLLRFVGEGWPTEWRVLEVRTTARE